MKENPLIGLVLTGGGARSAYQAGVISAISEITSKKIKNPFPIITGNSAGAINASMLAMGADNLEETAKRLTYLWENIKSEDVYRTDSISLLKMIVKWGLQLTLGSFVKEKFTRSLLDNFPLKAIIQREIDFDKISDNIDKGILHSFAIKVANYTAGDNRTFFQGPESIVPWERYGRKSIRSKITIRHVLASSAIPLIFPAVKIGNQYYGDGSLRNYTPLSPAIKLGAKKIVVIGARANIKKVIETEDKYPSIGQVLNLALNSIFLDAIDMDYERMLRINNTLSKVKESERANDLQPIDVLMIRPSSDIGLIAKEEISHLPKPVSHMIKGLGASDQILDLISYILFESAFTKRLIKMGYEDASKMKSEIEEFYNIN